MARKCKDDTPVGGWNPPGVPDTTIKPIRYADHAKNGKWVWKPVDAKYLKWCEEQKAKAMGGIKPAPNHAPKPAIRVRTRKRA